MDIKYVTSTDLVDHWSTRVVTAYNGSHKSYLPGIAALRHGTNAGSLLVLSYDAKHG